MRWSLEPSPGWPPSDTYPTRAAQEEGPCPAFPQFRGLFRVVGDTGFEPVTSSVSRKRATAAPIARGGADPIVSRWVSRWRRDLNPCTRLCRPLPRLSATPPRRQVLLDASERTTGLEPATSTLARLRSTN